MPEDIRKEEPRPDPRTGSGGGAAYRRGYGPGGLGSGEESANPSERSWDAPGVAPDGRRTSSSTDGPRIPVDGEGEPGLDDPEQE